MRRGKEETSFIETIEYESSTYTYNIEFKPLNNTLSILVKYIIVTDLTGEETKAKKAK